MSAADRYTAIIDSVSNQRSRINGPPGNEDEWGGQTARRFRLDPFREQDPALTAIASYIEPQDVVIDAGRVCLPLALQCHQVINVVDYSDPLGKTAMDAEGCKAFLPGITEGWEALEKVAKEEGLI